MKVVDLITQLSELDPETLVVMSSDSEGNSFKELSGVDTGMVFVPDDCGGEVMIPTSLDKGVDPEDVYTWDDGIPCCVLWP